MGLAELWQPSGKFIIVAVSTRVRPVQCDHARVRHILLRCVLLQDLEARHRAMSVGGVLVLLDLEEQVDRVHFVGEKLHRRRGAEPVDVCSLAGIQASRPILDDEVGRGGGGESIRLLERPLRPVELGSDLRLAVLDAVEVERAGVGRLVHLVGESDGERLASRHRLLHVGSQLLGAGSVVGAVGAHPHERRVHRVVRGPELLGEVRRYAIRHLGGQPHERPGTPRLELLQHSLTVRALLPPADKVLRLREQAGPLVRLASLGAVSFEERLVERPVVRVGGVLRRHDGGGRRAAGGQCDLLLLSLIRGRLLLLQIRLRPALEQQQRDISRAR